MGLDMYLKKHIYVGANYEHNNVKGEISLTKGKENTPIKISLNKVSSIVEDAGYWRKANQIHKWFVDNVQDGEDNCSEYYVSYEQLQELKALCTKVLADHNLAEELLPTNSGFFFGGTEYDEYYFQDLEETIKIINELDPDSDYYYTSSW